jgi:mono/diheme cytochrome c family protein
VTRKLRLIGISAILGVLMPLAAGYGAQTAGSPLEEEAARSHGGLLFQIHCASCHGLDARGGGPVAGQLRVPPADLTDLLAGGGSDTLEFPAERLRSVIDGRDDVRAHGSREMPVWGLTFQEAGRDANQEEVVLEKIEDLVEYLRTLQAFEFDEAPEADGED